MKRNHEYCVYCDLRETCKTDCKGTKITIANSTPAKYMDAFIPTPPGCYIPKALERSWEMLIFRSGELTWRPQFHGNLRTKVALIDYKGKGSRRTFAGWGIYTVDIGNVSDKFIEVAVIENKAYYGPTDGSGTPDKGPLKIGRQSHRIYFVVDPEKSGVIK